ncbi:hypothetical protein CCM_05620 [Cordyceps militaris CM01]|uniref:Uncharacterized protein n=1 Tax=Cordyceps militaris (strain CM01) TaxID=983644 RepID=G3JKM3_CORMM|nr:uncharacterized protein CCM_05620 [Cordyceps militaris CM01]EGX91462.1 hypothetical protein CCM_05620 [Cordyceps militaris CM01]
MTSILVEQQSQERESLEAADAASALDALAFLDLGREKSKRLLCFVELSHSLIQRPFANTTLLGICLVWNLETFLYYLFLHILPIFFPYSQASTFCRALFIVALVPRSIFVGAAPRICGEHHLTNPSKCWSFQFVYIYRKLIALLALQSQPTQHTFNLFRSPNSVIMAPSASKANYKSYEAQARLVRAIVAAHPTTKWNYKEIAACYGSDMSEHALNHRFRYIRAQSEIIMAGRKAKLDVKDLTTDESSLPKTVGAVDKKNIAKYFGQSTADGIQFQFRAIKKDADKLRAVADSGGDPSACLDLNSGSSSSGPAFTPTTTPKTSRSRNAATPTTGGGGTSTIKRARGDLAVVKIESDEEDSESTNNWSEMEATPSKRPRTLAAATTPGQRNGTPSRRAAAARASATIADASAQLQTSESEAETKPAVRAAMPLDGLPTHARNGTAATVRPSSAFATAATPATPSLFASVPAFRPAPPPPPPPSTGFTSPFTNTATDTYLGSAGSAAPFGALAADDAFYDDDDAPDGEY